ncbi:hypothetical protein LZ30DRAFT_145663 [Colletotrichum cereale]|nr:hypothetical protein LZ30DRAFT_145663 [Colletotrichum cereale]
MQRTMQRVWPGLQSSRHFDSARPTVQPRIPDPCAPSIIQHVDRSSPSTAA